MSYTIIEADAGFTPIAVVDSGVLSPVETSSGATTTYPTPPNKLGMIVRAVDPTYGLGEFIFLAGVASTTVGSVVTYNSTSFTTALAPVGSNKPQPIAIAMSANAAATTFGWYQISGIAQAAKTSGLALASNAAVGIATAGLIAASAAGKEVEGALTIAKSSALKIVGLVINRPRMQGRIT